jgi:hypothetical protein
MSLGIRRIAPSLGFTKFARKTKSAKAASVVVMPGEKPRNRHQHHGSDKRRRQAA